MAEARLKDRVTIGSGAGALGLNSQLEARLRLQLFAK